MLPTSLEIFIARVAKKKFKFLSPSIKQPYLRFLISIVKSGEFDKGQTKVRIGKRNLEKKEERWRKY